MSVVAPNGLGTIPPGLQPVLHPDRAIQAVVGVPAQDFGDAAPPGLHNLVFRVQGAVVVDVVVPQGVGVHRATEDKQDEWV